MTAPSPLSAPLLPPPVEPRAPAAARRRRKGWHGGNSVLAFCEPMMWLTGGGLVICLAMILGLLLLIVYQGLVTFWPQPLLQVRTVGDADYLGEVTRAEEFVLDYGVLAGLDDKARAAAGPALHRQLAALVPRWSSQPQRIAAAQADALRNVLAAVSGLPALQEVPAEQRSQLQARIRASWAGHEDPYTVRFLEETGRLAAEDPSGQALFAWWNDLRGTHDGWLAGSDAAAVAEPWQPDGDAFPIWAHRVLSVLAAEVSVEVRRRLLRTGNFELTNEHFTWVSDFEVVGGSEQRPAWGLVLERLAWGRFYGEPQALLIDGQPHGTSPGAAWELYGKHHAEVRERWEQRRELEREDTGRINRQLEAARLRLRKVGMEEGEDSPAYAAAAAQFAAVSRQLDVQFARIRDEILALDRENERYQLLMKTASGEEKAIPLAEIVRAYPANQLSWLGELGVYLSRWWEFLSDEPREANSEGGVLPAIFGTAVMTLLMSLAVVPFGVLAALYLREYAKAGFIVTTVRIAINNLAGVPSIVFGVFGLGFFCYIVGGSIDQVFFQARLPNPTFGTGGLMWASFTLALLTLPVVIVATEEALAAVPGSLRLGSYACGASKWQTIRRIVLPHAMPGVMTGMILAMARGAGEVAPLMLVGAVKLAPELPVDDVFPYFHFSRSFMHLGFHIYDLGFQSQNSEAAKPMVFTTTLLLITLIAFLNLTAVNIRARLRRRLHTGHF